jgi:hypothetical protein
MDRSHAMSVARYLVRCPDFALSPVCGLSTTIESGSLEPGGFSDADPGTHFRRKLRRIDIRSGDIDGRPHRRETGRQRGQWIVADPKLVDDLYAAKHLR